MDPLPEKEGLRARHGTQAGKSGSSQQQTKVEALKTAPRDFVLPVQESSRQSTFLLLLLLFAFRCLNALLVRTYDAPDEYWQSLEVAHRLVYGHLTWEWKERIRSYVHPLIFAAAYKCLMLLGLDHGRLITIIPRLLQACFAVTTDYFTIQLAKDTYNPSIAPYVLFCTLISWFNFYTSTRTFSNSMETSLTIIALYYWPRPASKKNLRTAWRRNYRISLILAALACIIRPTNVVIWIALLAYTVVDKINYLAVMVWDAAIVGTIAVGAMTIVDTCFYTGTLDALTTAPVFVPWKFFQHNVINSISLFYGSHPWHWYVTQGLPTMLTVFVPFVLEGWKRSSAETGMRYRTAALKIPVLWVIGVYSLLSHKEFRFVYPILPLLIIFASYGLQITSPKLRSAAVLLIIIVNVPLAFYTSMIHQRGVVDVIDWLRFHIPVTSNHSATVGFLMPCHSTPWYAQLHRSDIDMWFLTCEPDISRTQTQYLDEADRFYQDPQAFLETYFTDSKLTKSQQQEGKREWPEYVVLFESLLNKSDARGNPRQTLLARYTERTRFFNSHFHDDSRREGDVIVLQKK